MLVQSCASADYDASTGVCSAPVWVDQPQLLPPLSVDGAFQIAGAIVGVWAIGFIWRQIGKAISEV